MTDMRKDLKNEVYKDFNIIDKLMVPLDLGQEQKGALPEVICRLHLMTNWLESTQRLLNALENKGK